MEYINSTVLVNRSGVLIKDSSSTDEIVNFEHVNGILITIEVLCMLPTILGNILILVSISRFPGLCKATSGILIANLAVSDLLVGVVVFPTNILTHTKELLAKNVTCCLWYYALVATVTGTSVMNLFLLSMERFHAIIRPLVHMAVFTRRRVYGLIVAIWVFMIVFGFLPMVGWRNQVEEEEFVCHVTVLTPETFYTIFNYVIVISMIANTIFFFVIVWVVVQKASTLSRSRLMEGQDVNMKKDIHYTWMMIIVSGLFILFWGPYCVLSLVPNPSLELENIKEITAGVGLLNSCTNWIVYGCRSRKFRVAFNSILKCHCKSPHR